MAKAGCLASRSSPTIVLVLAAGNNYSTSSAQASISTGEQVGVVIIYVALGSLTVLAPLVIYLTMQDRAALLLADWRSWLEGTTPSSLPSCYS